MPLNVLAFRVRTHFCFVRLSYKCRREEIYLEKKTSAVRAEPAPNSELSLFSNGLKEKYRYPPTLIYHFFFLFCFIIKGKGGASYNFPSVKSEHAKC